MPGGKEFKYQQFTTSELIPKLARVIKNGESVKIWKKGEVVFSTNLESVSGSVFSFTSLPEYFLANDFLYASFSLNEMVYFFSGHVFELENGIVEMNSEVYRTEKRLDERLITFPNHFIFIAFTLSTSDPVKKDNVLSFQSHKNEDVKFLRNFSEEDYDTKKFRLIDLSARGASFFVNEEESKIFESDYLTTNPINTKLTLKDREIFLENLEVVYAIDYVNPRASGVSMKKVGVKFNKSDFLNKFLSDKIDEGSCLLEVDEQFEAFLNDRSR